jgi:hypothetical protein
MIYIYAWFQSLYLSRSFRLYLTKTTSLNLEHSSLLSFLEWRSLNVSQFLSHPVALQHWLRTRIASLWSSIVPLPKLSHQATNNKQLCDNVRLMYPGKYNSMENGFFQFYLGKSKFNKHAYIWPNDSHKLIEYFLLLFHKPNNTWGHLWILGSDSGLRSTQKILGPRPRYGKKELM